ncbi:MAG: PAS domain-containing methyl-accepting chemotaxis protein, partial [Planctomycetota bacterium]
MPLFALKKPTTASAAQLSDELRAELADLRGEVNALRRSQAVIEFELDGTILDANENFLAAVGYTLDEVRGQHHRIFCDPEEASTPQYREFWARLGRGEFDAGEYRRFTKDGAEIWIQASYNPVFDEAGRPVKVIKHAADITARRVLAAEHQGQVDAINKSQAVIEFDPSGTILSANENFLAAVGYTLDEVCGQHHRIFCDAEYAQSDAYRDFWRRLAAGEYQAGQYQRFGKGAREVWIQASYNPIFSPSGEIVKVVKYASDITAQVETKRKAATVGNTVAASVQEMVTVVDEIAQNVTRTATLAKDAERVADETGRDVESLGESSRKIGEVVGVIQELADQTNLLALNATIEAARAGESGRSFAVVASEVKELANATAKATQNIEHSVREIQQSIDGVVGSTTKITEGIAEVSVNTTTVAAAIEEQSATMAGLGDTAGEL